MIRRKEISKMCMEVNGLYVDVVRALEPSDGWLV